MTPDSELLRQYAEEGDDDAFAEVVHRQAGLVYSASLRVTGNSALAQDVTQTVFTKLAQQAGPLSRYDTLVGWLHTTARRAALNAVRGEARRRVREQESLIMHHDSTTLETDWEQVRPMLDEAVDTLSEQDRKAVLLRFFKDMSHEEVGAVLGVSEDGARKRVERALEKLHAYFSRRGITVSSALLATSISAYAVEPLPAGLAVKVAGVSLSAASAAPAGATLLALFMSTKTKIIFGAMIVAALMVTAVVKWQSPSRPEATPAVASATSKDTPKLATTAGRAMPSTAITPAAQVIQPSALQASAPRAEEKLPATPVSNGPFTASPKAELPDAIATARHFLANDDILGFLKTLMPPGAMDSQLKGASLEEYVAQINRNTSATKEKLAHIREVFDAFEGVAPQISADGTKATYTLDSATITGIKDVTFYKIDGVWYLNGI